MPVLSYIEKNKVEYIGQYQNWYNIIILNVQQAFKKYICAQNFIVDFTGFDKKFQLTSYPFVLINKVRFV